MDGEALRKVEAAQRHAAAVAGTRRAPIPVFVYLNRFTDVNSWPKGQSLLSTIIAQWQSLDPEHGPGNADFLQRAVSRGECIFLFDAFDELGSERARASMARQIGELAASAGKAGNRFVVSSRIAGYDGQLAAYGFDALTIKPLAESLIQELVTKWCAALRAPQLADGIQSSVRSNPRIADLAANPMLLSLIVMVQYVRGLIPHRRHLFTTSASRYSWNAVMLLQMFKEATTKCSPAKLPWSSYGMWRSQCTA